MPPRAVAGRKPGARPADRLRDVHDVRRSVSRQCDRRWLHLPRTSARGLDLDESERNGLSACGLACDHVVTRRDRDGGVDTQPAGIPKMAR